MILSKSFRVLCLLLAVLNLYLVGCRSAFNKEAADSFSEHNTEKLSQTEQKELLPQVERISKEDNMQQKEQTKSADPFIGPLRLSGVLISSNGNNLAIIESDNASYIVTEGDKIANYWEVQKVEASSVLLKKADRELILILPGANNESVYESDTYAQAIYKEKTNTEYIVKAGDTLNGISKHFNIDVSTLAEINEIDDKNFIYPGQKLLIPQQEQVSTSNGNTIKSYKSDISTIFLDIRGSDIRDVLSAIALHMGSHVIFLDEPFDVTFAIKDVKLIRALELLLQSCGLSYIQNENLIIVGKDDSLQNDFFNEMILTRFDLKYISSADMVNLINQLGISLQSVTVDTNPKAFWVQGTPLVLSKVKELVSTLDKPENAKGLPSLVRMSLNYITADKLVAAVEQLDLPVQLFHFPDVPHIVWVQGTAQSLEYIKNIIASLDIPESDERAILFLFRLNNISAADAAERLELFGFSGVKAITFNYPDFGKDLMIICPSSLRTEVTLALEGLDWRGVGYSPQKVTIPVDSAKGPHAYKILVSRRNLLIQLFTELIRDQNAIEISDSLWTEEGEEYRLLLVSGTPDFINKVKKMVELIKSP